MSGLTINDYMYFQAKLSGYKLRQQQVDGSDADVTYYGFIDRKGAWYIMKRDGSVSGTAEKSYGFIKGSTLYSTNWTGREALTYASFDTTFA